MFFDLSFSCQLLKLKFLTKTDLQNIKKLIVALTEEVQLVVLAENYLEHREHQLPNAS